MCQYLPVTRAVKQETWPVLSASISPDYYIFPSLLTTVTQIYEVTSPCVKSQSNLFADDTTVINITLKVTYLQNCISEVLAELNCFKEKTYFKL
jgi:hypothetical protein